MFEDVLCVIPARAGSKGITNKNKRLVSGIPLVIYSIRSALESGISHDHVVVSTDDPEIAGHGKAWGVHVRERPEALSGDLSQTEEALLDALEWHPDKSFINNVLLLQPTSPIRFKDRVKECLLKYFSADYDSLVSVTKMPNMFWHKNDKQWTSTYDPAKRKMKQELNSGDYMYYDNGNICITSVEVLKTTKCRIGSKPCIFPTSYLEGMQIDNFLELSSVDKVLKSGILRFSEEDLSSDTSEPM